MTPEPISNNSNYEPNERIQNDALSCLYVEFFEKIRNYLKKKGIKRELSEDLTQEVFLNVHKYQPDFTELKSVDAWLIAIARNVSNTYFRRKETRIELSSVNDQERLLSISATEPEEDSEVQKYLRTAISELAISDPIRAQALSIYLNTDCSVGHVREYLGKKSKHEASVYLYQSRKKLKPLVEQHFSGALNDQFKSRMA